MPPKKPKPGESLADKFPEIAKQWHPTKNGKLTPNDVRPGSNNKAWWKCPKGDDHEWETKICNKVKNNTECHVCSNRKIVKSNCLATLFPEIASQWHPTKNEGLTPFDVGIGTIEKAWWVCTKGKDHVWQTAIRERTKGSGCPMCRGLVVVGSNCLATLFPEISKEWHPTKNGNLTPQEFVPGSDREVWWSCSVNSDHVWKTAIKNRTKGAGCHVCWGRQISKEKNLGVMYPHLLREIHPNKNLSFDPFRTNPGSNKKVWWICEKKHAWEATVKNRVKGRGCPACNKGWTLAALRNFISSIKEYIPHLTNSELYLLFQQSGILAIDKTSKGKTFVEALKTGRFPREELEKFCDEKPSLVDDFINDKNLSIEGMEEDSSNIVDETNIDGETESLPVIETKDVLNSLNSKVLANMDEEAIRFFIASGVAKIWKDAFINKERAVAQAKNNTETNKFITEVRETFLREYEGACSIKIPDGYSFKFQPNLMQRLIAYRVKEYKRQGNWSGTGAGKTLSAILATRVVGAKRSVIVCPNAVVKNWAKNIRETFPDSVVYEKIFELEPEDADHVYVILNYEKFQQASSEGEINQFLKKNKIDFIVIDEIHYSKQRFSETMSQRKKMVAALITNASNRNDDLRVLGLSATPVINTLYEGISLLELISGIDYSDLSTHPSVPNCMSLYQKLATIGIRWMPEYKQTLNEEKIEIDCSEFIDEIEALGNKHTMLDLEKILLKAKLPEIKKRLKPKTVLYTHYVDEIDMTLKEEIEKEGFSVGFYTGDDKSGFEGFVRGNIDILIGSSSVGTGVDELQNVSDRLIMVILPWTNAEYEQIRGRVYRQGQKSDNVEIILPITYAEVNGERWSWCESKWKRIQFKKSIADACVDGVVPEGHLRSPAQAYQDCLKWLKRIESGEINTIERQKILIPITDKVIQKNIRKYGDFSQMNRVINQRASQKTQDLFSKNPEEWEQYHALYREARKEWKIVPYEEIVKWCKARPHLVIGDFGCGEAKISELLENTVYSFDHVAINNSVIAGDMSHVPLDNETLDTAIFSLSLMGSNFMDYIIEARRCLKLDGNIFIVEPTSRFSDRDKFCKGLEELGFDILSIEEKYKFTFIRALKSERAQREVSLSF